MSEIDDFPFSQFPAAASAGEPPDSAGVERQFRRAIREPGRSDLTWNVLTVLVWLLMVCMVMGFVSIYANPTSALNPFQPRLAPTLASALVIPTATPTPEVTLAGGAPTLEPTVTATSTLTPTATLAPTETPTPGPSPTPTIHSLYPFILRGEVRAIDGATFHEQDSCRLWVAGQAYDLQGAPMTGITVLLGGWLDGKTISQLSLTGTALQYGQAGYEFTLADKPSASRERVWVQLFDQAMIPLSARIPFDTYEDCARSLILINFRQVR